MRHVTIRDERMARAKVVLDRATAAYVESLAGGTDDDKTTAKVEHDHALAEWERSCSMPSEHYCGPCDVTHPTGGHGMLVLKRVVAPDGREFERSHDLHIVLCKAEWGRLGIDRLITRQVELEQD